MAWASGSGRLALRATTSTRPSKGRSRAAVISSGVRRRTNTGLPNHFTVSCVPGSTEDTSTKMEDSARTSAEGLIWLISGHTAPPTTAAPIPKVA